MAEGAWVKGAIGVSFDRVRVGADAFDGKGVFS